MNDYIIIQSTFFPPIQQLGWMMQHPHIVIEQHDTYAKQTFRNRMQIAGPNGIQNLSVPIEKPFGSQSKMKDIRVKYNDDWQKQIFRSIRTAYHNSAFYEYYIDDFAPFFEQRFDYLIDLNTAILRKVLEILELDVDIRFSEAYTDHGKGDFRDIAHPKPQYRKADPYFVSAHYYQLFAEKYGFMPNLSIIDLLFNEGPQSYFVLKESCVEP
ncbi:MAG: WbqC family protein [Salinivirgaceae bacterium]